MHVQHLRFSLPPISACPGCDSPVPLPNPTKINPQFDARNLPQLASYCNENASFLLPAPQRQSHISRSVRVQHFRPGGRMLVRARDRTGETGASSPKQPRIYADLHRLFAFDP
jgi:hypothetical protein